MQLFYLKRDSLTLSGSQLLSIYPCSARLSGERIQFSYIGSIQMTGLTFVQFSYVSLETRRLLFSPITSMVESGWRYPNLKPLRPLHWCSCWLWAGYNLCPAEIRCWRFEYLRLMEATDHPSALYPSHGIRANRRVNKLHIHLWEWRPNKMSVVRKFLADMGDKER